MKKFISRIALFFLPIIVLAIPMELLLRAIPNDYVYKSTYLKNYSKEVEVLLLGSSHMYYGVNPKYLEYKGFNAAHVSQSLNYDYAILHKYVNEMTNLKYVVVSLDYFSLYSSIETGHEKWRVNNYKRYYGIDAETELSGNFELTKIKFVASLSRLKRYYLDHKTEVICNQLGMCIFRHDAKGLIESGEIAAKRHTYDLSNKFWFDKNTETINELIRLADEKKFKLIFITFPAYKSYVSRLNSQQLDNTINYMTQLDKDHENVSYYNLLSDSNFVADDFHDADHLKGRGAKKMTLLLNELIRGE